MPQSFALEELFSGLIQAFGGARPTSGGLGELYEALIVAVTNAGGVPGSQGHQGFQGSAGAQGAQGNTGGAQGFQGFQGFQGNQGSQGSGGTGPQGAQGAQGVTGTSGNQGSQGVAGAQGAQGFQGSGSQGSQGSTGTQGNQGFQGMQGSQGAPAGPQGAQGAQGAAGAQGAQGSQGAAGAQGAQGFQGFQGAQGSQGAGGAVVLIASSVAGSAVNNFDFSSIPNTYNTLELIVVAAVDTGVPDNFAVRINGDVASNYDRTGTTNDGTTVAAHHGNTAQCSSDIVDIDDSTSYTALLHVWIPRYAETTFDKRLEWHSGIAHEAGTHAVCDYVFTWKNTAAINEVLVYPKSGNHFRTASAAYLYGIT